MAKQLYWLAGDTPHDDGHYHLLQPMFSSTLAHAVHAEIQDARFGETNKAARQARRENKPAETMYRDYRNLVVRKLGGTKPQNISQLNSERGGTNYLLPSLPPPAWKSREFANLLRLDSVFDDSRGALKRFGGIRELLDALADFLRKNPEPVMENAPASRADRTGHQPGAGHIRRGDPWQPTGRLEPRRQLPVAAVRASLAGPGSH